MPSPSRYPFPADEDRRACAWWDGLDVFDKRRWWPVLLAMTPAERGELHADRRATAQRLGLDRDETGGQHFLRREHEQCLLLNYWTQRLGDRLTAKEAA